MAYTKDEASTEWVYLTGADVQGQVDAVAKGLIAIGVKPGARVGIMSRTRYEWTVLDFAIWAAGAIPVPIYDTSSADQIDWITSDSEIRLLFVETTEHQKLAETVAKGESPLSDIRVIDSGALEEIARKGASVPDSELGKRKNHAKPDDVATIMYTSGTTGRPKGVRLTHFNYVRHVAGIQVELHEVLYQEGASTILFLTLAHSLARLVEVVLAATGVVLGFCGRCPGCSRRSTTARSKRPRPGVRERSSDGPPSRRSTTPSRSTPAAPEPC
jgi:long-chain acyl-CoA synthetase